ncbi:MAG: protein of unknown function rane lipoprotein [Firmicutes bacterium]|nr:protein of unknown function rane lipoprotein [Bacillota bacterium]
MSCFFLSSLQSLYNAEVWLGLDFFRRIYEYLFCSYLPISAGRNVALDVEIIWPMTIIKCIRKGYLMKKVLFAALLLLSSCVPAVAAPSINGTTGLINNPSADVLRPGQFSVGYYNLTEGGTGVFSMNVAPKLELGVAGFRADHHADSTTTLNVKFGLVSETVLTPGIALGVEDVANERERSIYAAASKALPFGLRVHAGVGNGRYNGLFAAVEKTVNPLVFSGNGMFPATTLIAEYDGKHMNFGARMSVVPGLKVDGGWRDAKWYVGVSYTN